MTAITPPTSPDTASPGLVAGPQHLRTTEVVAIALAPLVLAVGRLLVVPFNDQQWDQMLSSMAEHHSRNALGWSLALVAAALLAVSGQALVRLVPGRARLTAPALLGVTLGWVGTAGIATGGLVMGDMASSPERAAMVDVLTGFNEGSGNTIFFLVLAGILGYVLLATALVRGGVASRGTAVLLGVGAVASLVGAPGPFKPLAVSGAVVLFAAHLLVLRTLSAEDPADR